MSLFEPLTLLGGLSAATWAFLALGFRATSDARGITSYLVGMALLFAFYGLGLRLLWRGRERSRRRRQVSLLVFAAIFRLVSLTAGLPHGDPMHGLELDLGPGETGYETFLLYDNDLWRYLWDGALVARGWSPWRATPAQLEALYDKDPEPSEELAELFESDRFVEVFDNLSFASYPTVYGPVAQGLFSLSPRFANTSVLVFKGLLFLFDMGTCGLVCLLLAPCRDTKRHAALLAYAWNPLVIKEFTGSGHIDAAMVFLLVLAFYLFKKQRTILCFASVGLAALIKLPAAIVLPAFLCASVGHRSSKHSPRLAPLLGVTSFLSVLTLGLWPIRADLQTAASALGRFAAEWSFAAGPHALVEWLLKHLGSSQPFLHATWALGVFGLAVVFLACRATLQKPAQLSHALCAVLLALVWLSATVNPLVPRLVLTVCSAKRVLATADPDCFDPALVRVLPGPARAPAPADPDSRQFPACADALRSTEQGSGLRNLGATMSTPSRKHAKHKIELQPSTCVFLDITRALAAQAVLLGHALDFFALRPAFANQLPQLQRTAVVFFFLLSGLLIARSANRPSATLASFLKARARRIYSGLVPALLLIALLDTLPLHYFELDYGEGNRSLWVWLANLLNLQGYPTSLTHSSIPVFGSAEPLWTLSIEWWLYLFWGALVFLGVPKSRRVAALLLLGAAPIVLFHSIGGPGQGLALAWFYGAAGYGLLHRAQGLIERSTDSLFTLRVTLALLLALALLGALWRSLVSNPEHGMRAFDRPFVLLLGICFVLAVLLLQTIQRPMSANIERAARGLASYSYTLYLTHFTVLTLFYEARGEIPDAALLVVSLLLCNGLAFLLAGVGERRYASSRSHLFPTKSSNTTTRP